MHALAESDKELEGLLASFKEVESRASYLNGMHAARTTAASRSRTEVEELLTENMLLEKVQKVLMHLMDKMTKKDLAGMDNLVTYGLKTVFPDRNVSMRSEMVDTGKKIYIDMRTLDDGQPAANDQLGSASVIESFLLRVLCLLKTKGPRMMLLDEAFGAVEVERINNVGRLLTDLAKSRGIDMLLVTHNPGVSDAAMFQATLQEGNRLIVEQKGGRVLSAPETAPVEVKQAPVAAKKKAVRKPKEVPDAPTL